MMIQTQGSCRHLADLAARVHGISAVRKAGLRLGDCLIVETRNSSYRIVALGDGQFLVSGGWFDRMGRSPATVAINGCTWGGSAIHADLAAATGLFLEFGNKVLTTRIRKFHLIPAGDSAVVH